MIDRAKVLASWRALSNTQEPPAGRRSPPAARDRAAPAEPCTAEFRVGDRVNWFRASRGGAGEVVPVAGLVKAIGPARVTIVIARRDPFSRAWVIDEKKVTPEKLASRRRDFPPIDEALLPQLRPSEPSLG